METLVWLTEFLTLEGEVMCELGSACGLSESYEAPAESNIHWELQ